MKDPEFPMTVACNKIGLLKYGKIVSRGPTLESEESFYKMTCVFYR
eukprot:UN07224